MQGGYTGKVLRVNLTAKTTAIEDLPEEIAVNYIGGAGFGLRYLLNEVDPKTDPLGPGNKLIVSTGPLAGTEAPCASRMMFTAKSPATGAVAMSTTGGYFPAEMKFAGFDVLIIEGKAEEPAYLWIKDGVASVRNAKELWGTTTFDCEHLLKEKLGDQNVRVACIGQAGEKLSLMASIINEKHAAGRKGLGAVMGSKNLKAIVVRGSNPVKIANQEMFDQARARMLQAMKESPVLFPEFAKLGTPMVVEATSAAGIFPLKNFAATGEHDFVPGLGVEASLARKITKEYCYKCPVGCSQVKVAQSAPFTGSMSVPEYETYYSFGGTTMVDNVDAVIAADRLCDEFGIDTMSVGATIAFAMELREKGILTQEDTDGVDLSFGNAEAMVTFVKKIALRQGFGDILADGVRKAAQKIGKGSEKYALHVKGLELPAYDVRGAKAHGLNYATSYTGADHNRGYAFQEIFSIPVPYEVDRFAAAGKGKLTKWNQDTRSVCTDCAPMCGFLLDMALPAICKENTADLVSAATGLHFTPEDVYRVGERCNNTAKLFNVRAGFTRTDDDLPARLKTEPLKEGGAKGAIIPQAELDLMLDEYYAARGWTKDGVPTEDKLKELGLM
ncbi:MAG: aldehyde ferredoxin oxidoreductase family protein [Firmicutes bacterium]|nr:aldehyde ferredoxin oxidoreductase family protein [Bacillota bacterium]